nr:hypothetical protein [Kocuria soli]
MIQEPAIVAGHQNGPGPSPEFTGQEVRRVVQVPQAAGISSGQRAIPGFGHRRVVGPGGHAFCQFLKLRLECAHRGDGAFDRRRDRAPGSARGALGQVPQRRRCGDHTCRRNQVAGHQGQHRRFPGAVLADQARDLAGRGREGHIGEGRRRGGGIGERDTIEVNVVSTVAVRQR